MLGNSIAKEDQFAVVVKVRAKTKLLKLGVVTGECSTALFQRLQASFCSAFFVRIAECFFDLCLERCQCRDTVLGLVIKVWFEPQSCRSAEGRSGIYDLCGIVSELGGITRKLESKCVEKGT